MSSQRQWMIASCTLVILCGCGFHPDSAQEPARNPRSDRGFAAHAADAGLRRDRSGAPGPEQGRVGQQPLVQVADFSGKWIIDKERTGLGGLPDVTVEIAVSQEAIHFTKTQAGRPRDLVWDMVLAPDGSEGTYRSIRGNELRCSGRIVDDRLVVQSVSEAVRDGKVVFRDVREEYWLSGDGTLLFLSHRSTWNGQTSTVPKPIVFRRVIRQGGIEL